MTDEAKKIHTEQITERGLGLWARIISAASSFAIAVTLGIIVASNPLGWLFDLNDKVKIIEVENKNSNQTLTELKGTVSNLEEGVNEMKVTVNGLDIRVTNMEKGQDELKVRLSEFEKNIDVQFDELKELVTTLRAEASSSNTGSSDNQ